jgi:hypothetical protein
MRATSWVVRKQGDELLADHAGRAENPDFDMTHLRVLQRVVVTFVTKKKPTR